MQIIVPQDEISTAVEMLVRSQINLNPDQVVVVEFTNLRSPTGFAAEVTIQAAGKDSGPSNVTKMTQPSKPPAAVTTTTGADDTAEKPSEISGTKPSLFVNDGKDEAPTPVSEDAQTSFQDEAPEPVPDGIEATVANAAEPPQEAAVTPKSIFSKA